MCRRDKASSGFCLNGTELILGDGEVGSDTVARCRLSSLARNILAHALDGAATRDGRMIMVAVYMVLYGETDHRMDRNLSTESNNVGGFEE
jgi:hypothetical protein